MLDLESFVLGNGPVSFSNFRRAPQPPKNLGATIDLTRYGRSIGITSSSGAIDGIFATTAVVSAVAATVMGPGRLFRPGGLKTPKGKSVLRAVGSVALSALYFSNMDNQRLQGSKIVSPMLD